MQIRVDRLLEGVEAIDYEISGSRLVVTGEAPGDWIETLQANARAVAGIDEVDFDGIVNSDVEKLKAAVDDLSGSRFLFAQGASFEQGQESALRNFSERVSVLQGRAALLNYAVQVNLVGSTDSSGSAAANESIVLRRADAAATILSEFGVSSGRGSFPTQDAAHAASTSEVGMRSVVVYLTLVSAFDRS